MFELLPCFTIAVLSVYRSPVSPLLIQNQLVKMTSVSILTAICTEVGGDLFSNYANQNSIQEVDMGYCDVRDGVCQRENVGPNASTRNFPFHLDLTRILAVIEDRLQNVTVAVLIGDEGNIWGSLLTKTHNMLSQQFMGYLNSWHCLLILVLVFLQWWIPRPPPPSTASEDDDDAKEGVNNLRVTRSIKLESLNTRKDLAYWISRGRRCQDARKICGSFEDSEEVGVSAEDCIAWYLVSTFLRDPNINETDVITATESAIRLLTVQKESDILESCEEALPQLGNHDSGLIETETGMIQDSGLIENETSEDSAITNADDSTSTSSQNEIISNKSNMATKVTDTILATDDEIH